MQNFSLDARQLARIEAVHRGFLYQHLYAAACLFKAAASGVTHVVVENDEDVELVLLGHRIYVQIKTRGSRLIFSDVEGALARFDQIRDEHAAGRRSGTCQFVVVANTPLGPDLAERTAKATWPNDVTLVYPGSVNPAPPLPEPWPTVDDCPSSDNLRPFLFLRNGGSGSSGFEVMRPAADAASVSPGWSGA